MAVHDRSYKPYRGELTPIGSRFLVLPRYSFREIFRPRTFTAFFTGCFAVPLAAIAVIYVRHNLELLQTLPFEMPDLLRVDANFLHGYLWVQTLLAFILTMLVVPALLAPDLANGALPIYLAHPLSRRSYLTGKTLSLLLLLSAITWIPGLALCLLEGTLTGNGWLWENRRLWMGVFTGSWAAIVAMSIPALAISCFQKTKAKARGSFIAALFMGAAAGGMFNAIFDTEWGTMLNVSACLEVIYSALLGHDPEIGLPLSGAVASVAGLCVLSLVVIARRLRAYEVVK